MAEFTGMVSGVEVMGRRGARAAITSQSSLTSFEVSSGDEHRAG